MPALPGFVGPAYRSQSLTAAADRCINWYPESLENSGEIKANAALYPTPGLSVFLTLPTGPVQALFSQNGRVFAVAGDGLYEVFANGTYALRGNVATGPIQPTISSNGTAGGQLFIVAGGNGYILTLATNVFTIILDANFPNGSAAMGRFVDSYFAVLKQGTTEWRVSQLLNGLVWPGSDVAQRSFAADAIMNLAVTHREVWLFGSQTTEVWYNSGSTFPFQPITGVFLEEGCGAIDSVVNMDNTLYWVSQNVNGARKVLRAASGYQPQRISTHAIEFALQGYDTIADAQAYGYQDQGHTFYVLVIPSQNATWVFDSNTGLWHERAAWDAETGDFVTQRPGCHCYGFGKHLVGDRQSGVLYEQSIAFPSDGNGLIRRLRSSVHITSELRWAFYDTLQIDLETGFTVTSPLPDPLDVTTPGAATWIAPEDGSIQVECIGGGGGSRSTTLTVALAGGGGGSYARTGNIPVTRGQSFALVVGAGGAPGATQGATGGTSSFEALATAPGGTGGTSGTGGAGGVVGTGDVTFAGGKGGNGGCAAPDIGAGGGGAAGATAVGGLGADCSVGTAGVGNTPGGNGGTGGGVSGPGLDGDAPGGGASGNGSNGSGGASGADGLVRITYLSMTRTPEVMLRYSNDGARTWSSERRVSAGRQGEYHARVRWTRLGRGRDRVFEIAVSDAIPWRLSSVYLNLRPGDS